MCRQCCHAVLVLFSFVQSRVSCRRGRGCRNLQVQYFSETKERWIDAVAPLWHWQVELRNLHLIFASWPRWKATTPRSDGRGNALVQQPLVLCSFAYKDGAIVAYDLNCKKGVPAERLRHSGVQYKVDASRRLRFRKLCDSGNHASQDTKRFQNPRDAGKPRDSPTETRDSL